MRKLALIFLLGSVSSLVFAAAKEFQPLNVKTGLWRITQTIKWTGLPPQYADMLKSLPAVTTYDSCVAPKDLRSNPWADGSGDNCKWTVINSSSSDMEVQGTGCDLGKDYGMKADVHGKIHVSSPVSGIGSMDITLTGNGQTIKGNASYTGKWAGASCPAN